MNDITRADLDQLRQSLSAEIADLRREFDIRFAQIDAKLDAKPSTVTMFTGIFVVWFGMAGVIASTIGTLHTLGFIK